MSNFTFWWRKSSQVKKRRSLQRNRHRFTAQADILASIEIDQLTNRGIKGIILDLDNTIISEDDRYLSPEAENWIQQAKLAGLSFFILSNGKRRYRVLYWSQRLDIQAINPAKKPFPHSFRKAMTYMQLPPKQVIVIGDSFHTDVMGAKFCGCSCIQVATLPHPPRWWERLAGKFVQTPYPTGYELWEFYPAAYQSFL
ncbi:MAG: YqeG family HAD IIIA-type phosphatase [Nostocaceae cyanobacterium]|nr:YqeG family HAD IIIA-type phosphatase [Nostocaceae cyanobacterium]